jgi:aminoglycoside phosphotransferase (APT) family kinase protein
MTSDDTLHGLRQFLADSLRAPDLVITHADRAVAGFSWESWFVDAEWNSGAERRRFVARRVPEFGLLDRYDTVEQWDLQRALREVGTVPVPEPLFLDSAATATGRPLYVMEFVDGIVSSPWDVAQTIPDEQTRIDLVTDLARVGAAIHATPHDALPHNLPGLDDERPEQEVLVWEATYHRDRRRPIPVLDLAFSWLLANRHLISPRRTLVHGDFRLGNVISQGGRTVSMLDWEGAHFGDPIEDLANCCMRLQGGGTKTVHGIISTEQFLTEYEEASGTTVSRDTFQYWLVFNDARSAVVFVTAARRFEEGLTGDLRFPVLGSQLPTLLRHVLKDLPDH